MQSRSLVLLLTALLGSNALLGALGAVHAGGCASSRASCRDAQHFDLVHYLLGDTAFGSQPTELGDPPPPASPALSPTFQTILGPLVVGPSTPAVVAVHPADPLENAVEAWETTRPPRDGNRVLRGEAPVPWGTLTGRVSVTEAPPSFDDPLASQSWLAEESLRLPLFGSLFLFGQFGAGCPVLEKEDVNLDGRTGLDWKLLADPRGEISVRGGPCVACQDVLRRERLQEASKFLVEMQCRWTVLGPVRVEYSSSASSGLAATAHELFNQDLGVSLSLGKNGQLRCGARHSWDPESAPRPALDSTSLYFGLSLTK